jgi:hypothetical protein
MKNVQNFCLVMMLLLTAGFTKANAAEGYQDNDLTRTYDIESFNELFLEGAFKVYLIQGNENSLEVRASDSGAFDYLNIDNRNGRLHLHVDREPFDFSRVTLYLTFKNFERLKIEGGIKLQTRGYLDLDDFMVDVEGGAKMEVHAKARNIGIRTEGGVMFELDGVAESLDVKITGAGHVDADELKTKDVTFFIEGVGTGSVYATETLNATIKGVGKIKYRGNPQLTEFIDGLGSVERE